MMAFMRKWHRYLGLATTLLVVMVSITGILLIHKKDLKLNKLTVHLPGYAKTLPPDAWGMATTGEGKTILSTKLGVFVEGANGWRRTLEVSARKLYANGADIYACTPEGLHLSEDGGEIWRNILPGEEAKTLHLAAGKVVVATAKGIYQRTPKGEWDLLAPLPGKGIDAREILPADKGYFLAAKEGLYLVSGSKVKPVKLPGGDKVVAEVELQKIITDLHTGAFFGGWFMLVIDLVALSLIFFSVSGVWLWWVPRKKRMQNKSGY